MIPAPILTGLAGAVAIMAVAWAIQLRTRNAGIVDAAWAGILGALAVLYALTAPGGAVHRVLVGVLAGGWGLRLALHLLLDRVLGAPEEGRYVRLREHWGDAADRKLFWFFQAQALLAVLLSVPFWLAAARPGGSIGGIEMLGAALVLAGVAGESLADRQLARFKRDPSTAGQVCRDGLWRYSRHPNYFFEWVIWCGFAGLGLTAPWGALSLIAPALVLFLILKVTGIPPTEAQAVRSRGDAYREYQRTTSAFFPWPPKADVR